MANEPPIKTRPLVLRRDDRGQVMLFDEQTGEMLSSQLEVNLQQQPNDVTRVTVTFTASGRPGLRIEIND